MAARDYNIYGELGRSTLQRYILNSCDPQHYEPNLALDLEITDLINTKKGNAPREAAVTISHLVNSRNPNVSLLALTLLDICVKNCGYAFHLQISTKEFLNELVRKFPERPPLRYTRVQHRILQLIEEWRQTICRTSRYREDLGHIRDMHRLLLDKGYMFPEIRHEDAAVLNPADQLQSAEEMEEEEREAQSAKLQELIRRGTPRDLQEANRLMKVMAGFDTRHKTDYRAKAAAEVAKVQEKAKLLEEMLQRIKPGEKVASGDVFEELANALQSAHPKIQKMCEEESDDSEAVNKLLLINDSIHRTIERYRLMVKGDVDAATKIPKGTLGTTTRVTKNAANELSLIDLDGDDAEQVPSSPGTQSAAPAAPEGSHSSGDDLAGLSFFGESTLQPSISLGPSAPAPQTHKASSADILSLFNSPAANPSMSMAAPAMPVPAPFTAMQPASIPASPKPADPFASLFGPPQTNTTSPPPSSRRQSTLLDMSQLSISPPPSTTNQPPTMTRRAIAPAPAAAPSSGGDDEWNFASALPAPTTTTTTTVGRAEIPGPMLRIGFVSKRNNPGEPNVHVVTLFSNMTAQPITELHFQVAIEKAYSLRLTPQSGRDLGPGQREGVRLEMLLVGVPVGSGELVKLRYKVSYRLGGEVREEQGRVPSLGIA